MTKNDELKTDIKSLQLERSLNITSEILMFSNTFTGIGTSRETAQDLPFRPLVRIKEQL